MDGAENITDITAAEEVNGNTDTVATCLALSQKVGANDTLLVHNTGLGTQACADTAEAKIRAQQIDQSVQLCLQGGADNNPNATIAAEQTSKLSASPLQGFAAKMDLKAIRNAPNPVSEMARQFMPFIAFRVALRFSGPPYKYKKEVLEDITQEVALSLVRQKVFERKILPLPTSTDMANMLVSAIDKHMLAANKTMISSRIREDRAIKADLENRELGEPDPEDLRMKSYILCIMDQLEKKLKAEKDATAIQVLNQYLEGKSEPDIARTLGIQPGTVFSAVRRIRKYAKAIYTRMKAEEKPEPIPKQTPQ